MLCCAGEFLSLLGFRLGTSSRIQAGLYLETALVGDSPTLYALWPDGTCERMGLSGKYNTSLTNMIAAAVNASNSPAVAAAINAQLASLSSSLGGGGSGGSSDQMSQQVGPCCLYSLVPAAATAVAAVAIG